THKPLVGSSTLPPGTKFWFDECVGLVVFRRGGQLTTPRRHPGTAPTVGYTVATPRSLVRCTLATSGPQRSLRSHGRFPRCDRQTRSPAPQSPRPGRASGCQVVEMGRVAVWHTISFYVRTYAHDRWSLVA